MILYPQLPATVEIYEYVRVLSQKTIEECKLLRKLKHELAIYSATGGNPVTEDELLNIIIQLELIAKANGYPADKTGFSKVDYEWGSWLHMNIKTNPHEASKDGMWHFFSVVLAPDLVRWRWKTRSADGSLDRWVTERHKGRNAFGHLWWRCELLYDSDSVNPYYLIDQLNEDELVQITERTGIAGNKILALESAKKLLGLRLPPGVSRMDIFRDAQKRILRFGAFIDFQALDSRQTSEIVAEAFFMSMRMMFERIKTGDSN